VLTDLLRRAAAIHGTREAIRHGDRARTYAEAFERACRLANVLIDAGVPTGARVATLGRNRLESIEEIYAIALGGFVRSPLYTQDPPDRQLFMMERVGASALVIDAEHWADLRPVLEASSLALRAVLVHDTDDPEGHALAYEPALMGAEVTDPEVEADQDWLHVVRFSAGTTGPPKPIAHTERAYRLIGTEMMMNLPILDELDTYLAISPYSHGSGNLVWPMVACGGRHVVMLQFDAGETLRLIEQERVTVMFGVPAIVQALCSHPDIATRDLSSLRCIIYGAAPFPEATVRLALDTFGPVLVQIYGQSEMPCATYLRTHEHERFLRTDDPRLRSAGRASYNSLVRIIGPDGATLGPHESGEIVVKADTTMLGIWGDEQATRDRFVGDGWLRTNDVGHLDQDGYLFVTDRLDDMIISGGFNVSPAEIENALMSHPAVTDAVVFGVPHDRWGQTPMGVVRLKDGAEVSPEAIVAWSRERVGPVKKLSYAIITNDPLPMNAAGKVLRRTAKQRWGDLVAPVNPGGEP
jgi:acyl-CoA synthetase (AMP-forming)/AMP-acid ligase II